MQPSQTISSSYLRHESQNKFRQLPPPALMTGIGDASLKITSQSEQAQANFNQGLRLRHCFWDFEAYRAFQEAARLDPVGSNGVLGRIQGLSVG
jgi:hypothetical protein